MRKQKRVIVGVLSLIFTLSIMIGTSVQANEITAQDMVALKLANDLKSENQSTAKSFEALMDECSETTEKVVKTANITKFIGKQFANTTFSLIKFDGIEFVVSTTANLSKALFSNIITMATLTDAENYANQGMSYFQRMNSLYQKYGDGEVTDPDDAREIMKCRFYGSKYCLYANELRMPFIEDFIEKGGVSGILFNVALEESLSSISSAALGVFSAEKVEEIYKIFQDFIDGTVTSIDAVTSLYTHVTGKPNLAEVDAFLAKLENPNDPVNHVVSDEEYNGSSNTMSASAYAKLLSEMIEPTENNYYTTITKDITLSSDVTYSNLEISGGTINLNGYTMTVNGNMVQSGGNIYVNNGKLIVNGDYRIQSRQLDEVGKYVYGHSGGALKMREESDYVYVGGDFVTDTYIYSEYTAGTLEVKGDFEEWNGNFSDFNAQGNHVTVFSGNSEQKVMFESYSESGFSKVTFKNPNIKLMSGIRGFTLNEDINLKMGVDYLEVHGTLNLNGHSISDNEYFHKGNLEIRSGTIQMNGSRLAVDGNIVQSGGTIFLNGGSIKTTGDYRIQSYTQNDAGKYVYGHSGGALKMREESDYVYVGGDFVTDTYIYSEYTAGTLEVKGNFEEWNGSYSDFKASGSHVTIFSGNSEQKVIFESYSESGFAKVTFKNPNIKLMSGIRGFVLNEDINLKMGVDYLEVYGTLNLNGHSISDDEYFHKGNLEIRSGTIQLNGSRLAVDGNIVQSGGYIYLNSGSIKTTGDYRIQSYTQNDAGKYVYGHSSGALKMREESDYVHVGGDFVTDTYIYSEYTAGTLEVKGNFEEWNGSYSDFKASGSHVTIFSGNSEQKVIFESYSESGFAKVTFKNPNIKLMSGIRGFVLNEDINLKMGVDYLEVYGILNLNGHSISDNEYFHKGNLEIRSGTIQLNGSRLAVDGNIVQSGGTIFLNGGSIKTTGDYRIQSYRQNDAGKYVYGHSGGALKMREESDYVYVGGDFVTDTYIYSEYTAGTLEVKGNFEEWNGNYSDFAANGMHKTILSGEDVQNVNFSDSGCKFNTLQLTKPKSSYTFNPDPCWNTLIEVDTTDIQSLEIILSDTQYIWDGNAKEPTVTINDGEKTLVLNKDYTVSYENNIKVGTGKVIVCGKDWYSGEVVLTFSILASDDMSIFKIDNMRANVGDKITVPITIEKNKGFMGLGMIVQYDAAVFQNPVIEPKELFEGGYWETNTDNAGQGILYLYWIGDKNETAEGILANISFDISGSAKDGEYPIELTFDDENTFDENYEDVPAFCETAQITVATYTLGEVSGDNVINNRDAAMILRYIAGKIELTEQQLKAADVTKDGKVNNRDAAKILRYVSGKDTLPQ